MAKIRINYIEFKHAPKATRYSYAVSAIAYLVYLFFALFFLFGVASILDGEWSGIVGCAIPIGAFYGYKKLYSSVIFPWLCRVAAKERAEFYERLRRANEDPR